MHDAGCTMLDAGLMDYWIDGLLDWWINGFRPTLWATHRAK
jgi:hypothetical protein